jgi:hypothetical protein
MQPKAASMPPATTTLQALAAAKAALAAHPLYTRLTTVADLRTFTAHHVACVWDFMSLLKSLQHDLAPTTTPWRPPADPEAARLINEIVVDEESDALPYRPGHASHFTWYTEAMQELGADTTPIRAFLAALAAGTPPLTALAAAELPAAARAFTATTLSFLAEPLPIRAAVFLHGREDLIPRMFTPLVRRLHATGVPCARFLAYLDRHIEVDGGAHGAHATALLTRLFDSAPHLRERGERAALRSLDARRQLWDAVVAAL